jgi:uncharacterized repeat protein (TIGR02543 family)
VTFVDWDGTVLRTETVEDGTSASAPADPVREGYTFTGWDPSDFSNITGDLTVTAQYTINTYSVVFDADGGTPAPPEQLIEHGGLVAEPPAPAKDGFTLVGWYADAGLTDAWDFATDTVTSGLTLYAKYAPVSTAVEFVRWGGIDRYETAVIGAYATYPGGTDVAILAVGTNFPDALAASPLAGITDAPILLTRTETLHPLARQALVRLGVSKVYIMGSPAAVSTAVETEVERIAGIKTVVRLGGLNRYETARLIANEVLRLGGSATEIFLTRGDDFPDALSVSSTAAQRHMPVLLTRGPSLEANAAYFIRTKDVERVYIAGGENVVPEAAADGARAAGASVVVRWAGANRYETSATVIKNARSLWGITAQQFGIATGVKFPDALTGGALMGRLKGVLVLSRPDLLSATTRQLLVAYKPEIRRVIFFGSTAAISQATEDSARAVFR